MKKINEWKEQEIKIFIEEFKKAKLLIKELKEKYGREIYTLGIYHDIPTIFKTNIYLTEKGIEEIAVKETERHFKKLQDKVINKIGVIKEIKETGDNDYNYTFIGENGRCKVEVVLAGGYNIQRLHTRWIIKK